MGAPNRELFDRVVALLPPGLPRCDPGAMDARFELLEADSGGWRYLGTSGRSPIYPDVAFVIAMLDSELRRWVADNAQDDVFVHAGVVAHDGCAIVLPGDSFSGKTSLVAELVRAGAAYYSDEYAVIDGEGLVHPFARPLSIRTPGRADDESTTAASLGGKAGTDPVPVGVIATTVYRPGATFRPDRRTPGEGMLALLAHTSNANEYPQSTLAAVRQAAAEAMVLDGERGEAAEAARILMALASEPGGGRSGRAPAPAAIPRAQIGEHDVAFEVYGSRVRVEVPSAELVAPVLQRFPLHAVRAEPRPGDRRFALRSASGGGFSVLKEGAPLLDGQPLENALDRLRFELFYFATHHARDHLVISAAVVGHEGRGIVLLGAPREGKTVLMAALLRAGATYFADDWGVIDGAGRARPLPTNFRLDGEKVSAKLLGAVTGETPIPVGLIVRAPYAKDARWSAQRRASSDGAAMLLAHAYGMDAPTAAMRIADAAAAEARVIEGERGEADEAAAAILRLAVQSPVRG